jgi:hypothetical protein
VADRRATDPSWSPTKERTLADEPEPAEPADSLATWLAERERGFDRWLREYAGGSRDLDFSAASLPALHTLVRRTMPGGSADFDEPEHREFVDGATWYYGEVVRRATGAQWRYVEGDSRVNPLAGQPYLQTSGQGRNMDIPLGSLEGAADSDDPRFLNDMLARFD